MRDRNGGQNRATLDSLQIYFTCANQMYHRFVRYYREKGAAAETFLYACLWLAALNVVVEGWKKAKKQNESLSAPRVEALLTRNTSKLKGFRNAIYHFRPDFPPASVKEFLASDKLSWAKGLHEEYEQFFRRRNYYG